MMQNQLVLGHSRAQTANTQDEKARGMNAVPFLRFWCAGKQAGKLRVSSCGLRVTSTGVDDVVPAGYRPETPILFKARGKRPARTKMQCNLGQTFGES